MNKERPIIELLPPLSKKCRAIVIMLRATFTLIPILIGIWSGAEFGWLYGLLFWILSIFASLIVLSKIKLAFVPLNQHELSHSATAILKWYAAKEICRQIKPTQRRSEPDGQ
ncbi:MAG: hypothetical protein L3J42_03975 [Hydrogenimonas sp.]|nr:hypothetical protein [Hydrogenimonas sp.]